MPQPLSNAPQGRWYPSVEQVKTPEAATQTLRVVLDQFYALQESHGKLQAAHSELQGKVSAKQNGPPAGSGPADSMLLGLRVAPTDTSSLANGAALKYNKSNGNLEFS